MLISSLYARVLKLYLKYTVLIQRKVPRVFVLAWVCS